MILSSSETNKSTASDGRRKTEDYIGNNKKYSFSENKNHVRIIGNGNKIYLTNNSGTLQIIGNSVNVRIMNNCGSIVYTGNNGKVVLSDDSSIKNVQYVGFNGSIKIVPKEELLTKKTAKVVSLPLHTNHLSHDDCNNLFERKFKRFTNNNYFSMNNVSMPNLRGLQIDLSDNLIKIGKSNIVIDRS